MKLRDLARGSSNPTSFMPAFHVFRSRFRNRETSKRSRKSYESVLRSLSAPPLLTLLQQTTVVSVPRVLCHPRHPGSCVTFPIRTYHGYQNLCDRTCHTPVCLMCFPAFPNFEQSQSKVYREVLITGDLTQEDSKWAATRLWAFQFGWLSYGSSTSETAELLYENETVYFAQPRLSQLIPGGFGPGALQPTLIGLGGTPNNSAALTGSNTPKRDVGVVLRCVLHARWRRNSTS